ncbi:MAG: hypothetical protein JNL58_27595 [Planctomyces sp.]|nr:hypothetical protein [Planctomyces sp.]
MKITTGNDRSGHEVQGVRSSAWRIPLTIFQRQFTTLLFIYTVVMAGDSAAAGDPALPGNHPLTQAQAGSVLISELRCAACHNGFARSLVPEKTAPDLTDVGARISPNYMKRFLSSPSTVHPGTTMPDILVSQSETDKELIAEALTHFLIAQSKSDYQTDSNLSIDRQLGKTLFHSVGCVACHGSQEHPLQAEQQIDESEADEDVPESETPNFKPVAFSLAHVKTKYSTTSLSDFLFQPLRVRTSGRMPDMKLTPTESLAIAGYLSGERTSPPEALRPDAALVQQGRRHFQELNCVACHTLPGFTANRQPTSLRNADESRGCLSETSNNSPRFHLENSQIQAIAASLREEPTVDAVDSDSLTAAKMLTAFNCITCHVRDDYGGVHEEHNDYFIGSEQKLGDDGRIPPPLTLIGAKLRPTWLKKVLFDGETVRHYMSTRMPQYGSANLQHLPAVFARLDVLKSREIIIPNPESRTDEEREREKLLRAAGRELLGDKGVNCVSCHSFNGKAPQLNPGIDLLTSYERLQPEWFDSYLRNPGRFRPRTVMPTAWPNGVASFKTILEGNTDLQIDAIWYYLSLGTSAADPSGVRSVSTVLSVSGEARIHRGRSQVAGYRGIAVGLPERLSYAFNAETGTLSAIWQGDFIRVNWSGQGSGDFNPASEPVRLPQDVSFMQLGDENAPWPRLPVMTKEARTNPDPLYSRNAGYQFRGYSLGDLAIPTFLYRCGSIEIEDRSTAAGTAERLQLRRVLQFDSTTPQSIWFRAMTGEIQQMSDRVFENDELRLTVPSAETKLRVLPDEPNRSELILRLQIPQGKSTLEFFYEPLRK